MNSIITFIKILKDNTLGTLILYIISISNTCNIIRLKHRHIRKLYRKFPTIIRVNRMLSKNNMNKNNYEKAEQHFENMFLIPSLVKDNEYVLYAEVLINMEKYEKSITILLRHLSVVKHEFPKEYIPLIKLYHKKNR